MQDLSRQPRASHDEARSAAAHARPHQAVRIPRARKLFHTALALPLILSIAACGERGASYTPIVDGTPSAAFQSDLSSCQHLAKSQRQLDRQTLGAAAVGAGIGAVLGDADTDGDGLGGAVVGALAGGVSGAAEASDKREAIVIECLRGRSHKVVG